LVGLLALALASIFSRAVGTRLDVQPNQVENSTGDTADTRKAKRRPQSHYSVILDKNIFHAIVKETKNSPPKAKPDENPTNLEKTPLEIRLRGTAVRDGGSSFAIIEDRRSRKEDLYHIGDTIQGEAKITQILRDRVVILRDGKKEILELSVTKEKGRRPQGRAVTSKKQPAAVPGKGIRRLGSNRWSVSSEELESAKSNMSQLMTQVRVTPNFTEGQPDGFKLLSIKRGSLFERLGLRNGDIVRQINGASLDNPQRALELYGGLESGQTITLGILRRGKEQTLRYELK
jgi:general secretion pathway protein C